MDKPFLKTLNGKFVSRTVMLAVAIAVIIGGLAVISLRSLKGTANASVEYARDRLPQESVEPLEALASDISAASSRLTLLLILITVIGAIAAGALALMFARQITAPIVRLRNAAMKSASALPEIVEASANGDEVPELPSIVLTSGDEVEELADSFNVVQRTAAELAVKQARMRQQNGERFVNLGRRSQNLLARQMSFIDAMEKDEANPANLKRLFQIDHLATRMRRNAESVLVLADESSPRSLRGPVSMHQVVQAASGEIEHFDRIAISGITDTAIEASVAHDLAHLLAELLENATSFAPPETATTVSGIANERGYLVEIIDHGIGMEPDAMGVANARFADLTSSPDEHSSPSYLGHDVVNRLARRHGVGVELTTTPTGGVTVRLQLPHSALSSRAGAAAPAVQSMPAGEVVAPADPAPFAAPEPTEFPVAAEQPDTPLSEPVAYTPPAVSDAASSLEAFTPPVPDDASALIPSDPFPVDEAPAENPSLEGFSAVVPDDVSSLIDASAPLDTEISALAVPDDASSLTELPGTTSPVDVPAFDIPAFDEVAPAAEVPAFDVPAFDEATPAPLSFDDPTPEPVSFDELDEPHAEPAPAPASFAEPEAEPTPAPASFAEPEAEPAPAPSVFDEPDAEPADQGLTAGQLAAIEWARQNGGGVSSDEALLATAPAAGFASELRPGPIDAATLSGLDATPAGFVQRVHADEGATAFSPAVEAPRRATPDLNPEQLMKFREGLEASADLFDDGETR